MADIQKIPLNQVKLGMYITEIEGATRQLKVKMGGRIKKQQHLEKMKIQQVKYVYVDFDRNDLDLQISPSINKTAEKKPKEVTQLNSEDISNASSLYDEAKAIQEKLLNSVSKKKVVDYEIVQASSKQIIDSVFQDSDALLLISNLKNVDNYHFEQAINSCILMTTFAIFLGFEKKVVNDVAIGAFMHDLGISRISPKILNKPGSLNEQEFEEVKKHVGYVREIMENSPQMSDISVDIVANHHERLDGSGYPNGLDGDKLDIYARMMAIVDTFNAMTSDRHHQKSCSQLKAFNAMLDKPEHYDQKLVQKFIKCLGIYPVGSLVKLKSGRIGIVYRANRKEPLKPKVISFYSLNQRHYTEAKMINLAKSSTEEIEMSVQAEEIDISMNRGLLEILFSQV